MPIMQRAIKAVVVLDYNLVSLAQLHTMLEVAEVEASPV
jgi:hypothetical protein